MTVDEQVWHLRIIVRGDGWAAGFAKSVIRQARRRDWRPSPKQDSVIRRLIAEMLEPDDGQVLEDIGP
jgi:hypothetical protein